MSKVKITGNASGTGVLTVEAPNTNTDRTVTLPDATGTLLMTDGDGSSLSGITSTPEGTAVLSTGEGGGIKFLREDGDGTCSWQTVDSTPQVYFRAEVSTGQTYSGNAKSSYQTEVADTHGYFDISNDRFTPLIAGYYLFIARISVNNSSSANYMYGRFEKNGSGDARAGHLKPANNYLGDSASAIIYMNGSTDYVEHWVGTSSSVTTEGYSKGDFFMGLLLNKD